MAQHNIETAMGADMASRLRHWQPGLVVLERRRRSVETDSRLHGWEWLVQDGRLLKTDALDHHAGHDLVGPQDIAWDVAGAAIEFALGPGECDTLAAAVEQRCGMALDPELLAFYLPCYAAFQLGYYVMAAGGSHDPEERSRLDGAAKRYRRFLDRHLLPL
jgi:hypothetical protein